MNASKENNYITPHVIGTKMYEHQSERMTLGTQGISVDESISDCQHSPYKTLRKYSNSSLFAKRNKVTHYACTL